MSTQPEVIGELRTLFREGATPSRLIRHIVERHYEAKAFHSLIQDYFREAFGIPIVRGLSPIDRFDHADLRYAFLNEQLLYEMLQKHNEWDESEEDAPDDSVAWFDSLNASDSKTRNSEAENVTRPELSRCWPLLTPEERAYIGRSMASAQGLNETIKILSRLAECLQLQLTELRATAGTSAGTGASLSNNR